MGPDGLRSVSDNAILNANYIMKRLEKVYDIAVPGPCMHECVLSARRQKKLGVTATDIAKRLLDLGFYAPSTYFPLIVEEALMIEPTESPISAGPAGLRLAPAAPCRFAHRQAIVPADGRRDSRADTARCVPTQVRQDTLQDLAAYPNGVNRLFHRPTRRK